MMQTQKKIAARILKCGSSKIWLDPARMADVEEAITAADVRRLINDGAIVKVLKTGISNYRKKFLLEQKRKGRRKGRGSRKGSAGVRMPRKKLWVKRIRIMRSVLAELRKNNELKKKDYRTLYKRAKGGFFRSRAHLLATLEKDGYVKKEALEKFKKKG